MLAYYTPLVNRPRQKIFGPRPDRFSLTRSVRFPRDKKQPPSKEGGCKTVSSMSADDAYFHPIPNERALANVSRYSGKAAVKAPPAQSRKDFKIVRYEAIDRKNP